MHHINPFIKYFLLAIIVSFITIPVCGQRTIRGTITDAKTGEPVIGANIVVKGNEINGTISGVDGKYAVKVPQSGEVILKFSFLGYIPQEIRVFSETIDVAMEDDDKTLDMEVVISKPKTIQPYIRANTDYTPFGAGVGWDFCRINWGDDYSWTQVTGAISYHTNFEANRITRAKMKIGDIFYANSWINDYWIGLDIRYDHFDLEQPAKNMSAFRAGMTVGNYRTFMGIHMEKARVRSLNPEDDLSFILSWESNFNIIKKRSGEEDVPDWIHHNWLGDNRPKVSFEAGISKRKQIQFGAGLSVAGSYFKMPFDTDIYAGYWMKMPRYKAELSRTIKKIRVSAGYEQIRHYNNLYLSFSVKIKTGACSSWSGYSI